MIYHILNGDALAHGFSESKITGEIIICREAFMEGDVSGETLDEIMLARIKHHKTTKAAYKKLVVKEFEKILNAPDLSEFNLWFEYDLFCQVNLWFIFSLLHSLKTPKKVYLVYASQLKKTSKQFWNGFGKADSKALKTCFSNRIALTWADIQFGAKLWAAYKIDDQKKLMQLAKKHAVAFPFLKEVVQAHLERFPKDGTIGRPEKLVKTIMDNGIIDFEKVCKIFWMKESIYGFGDTQIKKLYDKLMSDKTI